MSVFQNAVVSKKRIEPQSRVKNSAPPHRAGGSPKIKHSGPAERRLHVGVDRVPAEKIISARLVCTEQPESTIPFPPQPVVQIEVLVRAVADYSPHSSLSIGGKSGQHVLEELFFQPHIVVDKSDERAPSQFDPRVPLNSRTSSVSHVPHLEWQLAGKARNNRFGVGLISRCAVNDYHLQGNDSLTAHVLEKTLDFVRAAKCWRN